MTPRKAKEHLALGKKNARGWKRDLFAFMETAPLETLEFVTLPDSVKQAHSPDTEVDMASIIVTSVFLRLAKEPVEEELFEPIKVVIIALGVGHVAEEIKLTPRGGPVITSALREVGILQ